VGQGRADQADAIVPKPVKADCLRTTVLRLLGR